jgi:hypothetical protein
MFFKEKMLTKLFICILSFVTECQLAPKNAKKKRQRTQPPKAGNEPPGN